MVADEDVRRSPNAKVQAALLRAVAALEAWFLKRDPTAWQKPELLESLELIMAALPARTTPPSQAEVEFDAAIEELATTTGDSFNGATERVYQEFGRWWPLRVGALWYSLGWLGFKITGGLDWANYCQQTFGLLRRQSYDLTVVLVQTVEPKRPADSLHVTL